MDNRPICFFDSGIGGATILREVVKLLPNEGYVYYADSINNPYGEKSKEECAGTAFARINDYRKIYRIKGSYVVDKVERYLPSDTVEYERTEGDCWYYVDSNAHHYMYCQSNPVIVYIP